MRMLKPSRHPLQTSEAIFDVLASHTLYNAVRSVQHYE